MEFVSHDFSHLTVTKSPSLNLSNECELSVRLPYEHARMLLMAVRSEMDNIMRQAHPGEQPPTNKTHYLFGIPITSKFISGCSYQFCERDIPTLDMNTGELSPPQQLDITITFFQE